MGLDGRAPGGSNRCPSMRKLTVLGLGFVLLLSCKEEPKKESSAPKGPQAIPSDFVVNSFFNNDSGPPAKSGRNAPAADSDDPQEPPDNAPSPAASNIKLLEAGDEPRAVRRYDLKVGKTETLAVVVRPSMVQEIAGQKKPGGGSQPPTQFTIAVTPTAKTPAGEYDVKFTLLKADIAPGADESAKKMAAQLGASLKALVGLAGGFRIGARGSMGKFALSGDAGGAEQSELLPLVQQSLEGLVVALPEEAVGKGAKWEDRASGKQQGLASTVVSTYTLKDVSADALTIDVSTSRKAAPQPIPDPRAPPGSSLAIDGTASSNVKLKLDRMVVKATSDSVTSLIISQPGPTGPQVVTQKVTLKQSIENTGP